MSNAAARFDQISTNFVASEVHRSSPTITRLLALLDGVTISAICDVACGAGHLGLSFAGKAARFVAVDPAPNMLSAAERQATERGIVLEVYNAPAESIPLGDAQFDLVASRLAPHHFSSVPRAISEMARVAKSGGLISVIDLEGNEEPAVDDFNHRLELLHDPTHVRSYTADAWRMMFEEAGLEILNLERRLSERPTGVSVSRWCEIASSGSEAEREIIALLDSADAGLLDELGIRKENGNYLMPIRTVLILARKA